MDHIVMKFQDDESFFLTTYGTDGKPIGSVRIGISVIPGIMANANPVGKGRSDPNHSPFLSPPVGRLTFSLNPFSMLVSNCFY